MCISRVVLINTVKVLMITAKLAALGLPKVKIFGNKCYDVITFVHGVTRKTLSRD